MILRQWLEAAGSLIAVVILACSAYVLTRFGMAAVSAGTLTALDAAGRVALLGYLPVGIALGVIEWRSRTQEDRAPRVLPVIRWVTLAIGYGALVSGVARVIVNL